MGKLLPTVPVVVDILRREEKILICLRPSGKPYSGYWEFPGGKIEENESGREALERELKEELGIQIINATLWFTHIHEYPDKKVFLQMWLVEKFSEEPKGQENQEIRWATIDEIHLLQILEGNKAIISKIQLLLN